MKVPRGQTPERRAYMKEWVVSYFSVGAGGGGE